MSGEYGRRSAAGAVEVPAMAEQSHREEMNAAIRAQRERSAVPKTIVPEPPPPEEETRSPTNRAGSSAAAEARPRRSA